MTLKRKVAVNIALAFSILFGLAATYIYISFSNFRKEEFKERLEEKALTTAKLLIEVKEIDKQLLKLIDHNTINKLYNEKTLIFDADYKLIYSSIDKNTAIHWTKTDLVKLNNKKPLFKEQNGKELLGIMFPFEQGDYYVLISAEDKYGYSKMEYLFYSLIITFLISIALIWTFTYYFIKKLLNPLDVFQQQITSISANELNIHLQENNSKNEINLLTKAFNQMLTRLENSFSTQREFTSNASHELYTPLTRIAFQLENIIHTEKHSETTLNYLNSINNDIHQIADLINSLLLLAKVNKEEMGKKFENVRIDETIFEANEIVKKINPNFYLNFEILASDEYENAMEVPGIHSLLLIAFTNLLKNALLYSSNNMATITINQISGTILMVSIFNEGGIIPLEEQNKLFEPFMRGSNSNNVHGSGLGLPIVKRILDYHNATIAYRSILPNTNVFDLTFSI